MADRRRRDKGKVEVIPQWGATRRRSKSKAARPLIIISSSDSDKEKEPIVISSSDSDENERPTPSAQPSAAKKKVKEEEFELPPGAKLIADCEAADILQGIEARLESSLKNMHISIPKSFPKSLQYSKDNAVHYTDTKSVKRALERLKEYGATDWEICMIANSCPESCEEAYALIPSLKGKEDTIGETLNAVLTTLARFKVDDD
ncbi:DNA-directed RNA polymerases IV and V subunit 4-like [Dendrobium catenatum]|uniref:RNA polymerase Rpb4/RPC9 core domain-containing protein n=1 Tax=Dendrobium catenatum TaxID=906689 RepID=A0A2I0WUY6_9ASPA|nr:DNA-directed RNA polymerases IV and V subunit 4-like [Dendrobium catenatum]PKU79474.1 hypothetical protein MA16_Dca000820 [Dendrobium catenatum]